MSLLLCLKGYILVSAVVVLEDARALKPGSLRPHPRSLEFPHAFRRDRDTGSSRHALDRPCDHAVRRTAGRLGDRAARRVAPWCWTYGRGAPARLGHPRGERGDGCQAQPGAGGAAAVVRGGGTV